MEMKNIAIVCHRLNPKTPRIHLPSHTKRLLDGGCQFMCIRVCSSNQTHLLQFVLCVRVESSHYEGNYEVDKTSVSRHSSLSFYICDICDKLPSVTSLLCKSCILTSKPETASDMTIAMRIKDVAFPAQMSHFFPLACH